MGKNRSNLGSMSTGLLIPVMILGGAAFGYFAAWPQRASLAESRALLATKQAEVADRESSLASIKKLNADVESKRSRLLDVDAALPHESDIPGLLANLEYLALQSGLSVLDIQIQEPTEKTKKKGSEEKIAEDTGEKVKTLKVEISAAGQYPQLLALILNMEQNLRLFDIQGIDFNGTSAVDEIQSYTIRLHTYYQESK